MWGLKNPFKKDPAPLGAEALSAQPPQPMPKVKPGQQSLPSFLKSAKVNTGSAHLRAERNLVNTDITTLRTGASTYQVVRDFVKASPDLGAAVTSYVRTGITSGYVASARNMDGTVNAPASEVLAGILTRLNVLNDYTIGYDDTPSIRALCETWAVELLLTGGMAGELVLDKQRLPLKIQPLSVGQIKFFPSPDGLKLIPVQVVSGTQYSLDVPTFFMVTLDQDTISPYPSSPLEPALQAVVFSADFMNDIRKIVKQAIHPRVLVTIDSEKLVKRMDPETRSDPEKAAAFCAGVLTSLQSEVQGLRPEDALVVFDEVGVTVMDHGNTNLSNEYQVIQGMADAKLATGAKVLPTVLGHSNGTSNTASAEVQMFLKYVEGSVWGKLNEMLSKVLTLAVRLYGVDVYVDFRFNTIELRPESELEAFKSMKQSRYLDLLSLGMVSDEEASLELTGHLPPKGYKPLSGTLFRSASQATPAGDGYNGASNSGSTLNQNLKSDAPTGVKSPRKEQK